MPDYDRELFDPPAPVARVTVRSLDRVHSLSDIAMLIDSGADVTLIPRKCAELLGLEIEMDAGIRVRGFGSGSAIAAKVVQAEVVFLDHNFRGRFILTDDDYGIFGRNVLNKLSLLLDGPHLTWREAIRSNP